MVRQLCGLLPKSREEGASKVVARLLRHPYSCERG